MYVRAECMNVCMYAAKLTDANKRTHLPHAYTRPQSLCHMHTFSRICLSTNSIYQWARIIASIENEMSAEERELPSNKYWTVVDGQKYLQVEELESVDEEETAQTLAPRYISLTITLRIHTFT